MSWDESKHPRVPAGSTRGGQFAASMAAAGVTSPQKQMFLANKLHLSSDKHDFHDAVASGLGEKTAGRLKQQGFYKQWHGKKPVGVSKTPYLRSLGI